MARFRRIFIGAVQDENTPIKAAGLGDIWGEVRRNFGEMALGCRSGFSEKLQVPRMGDASQLSSDFEFEFTL